MADSTSQNPEGQTSPSNSPSLPPPPTNPPPASQGRSSAGRSTPRKRNNNRRKKTTTSRNVKPTEPKTRAATPKKEETERTEGITPDEVRDMLEDIGEGLHDFACTALKLDPKEWPDLFTWDKRELDKTAPALSRVLNRHRRLEPIVKASDELLVTLKIGKYVTRNIGKTRAAAALPFEGEPDVDDDQADDESKGGAKRDVHGKVVGLPPLGGVG